MLGELLEVMETHRQRQRFRRTAGVLAAALVVTLGAVYFVASAGSTAPSSPAQRAAAAPHPAVDATAPSVVTIARVHTNPSVLERYRAAPRQAIDVVSDAELLLLLHEIERPAGLVRMGDDVFLTAFVADQPARDSHQPNSL
jgi:hypothetical protein